MDNYNCNINIIFKNIHIYFNSVFTHKTFGLCKDPNKNFTHLKYAYRYYYYDANFKCNI